VKLLDASTTVNAPDPAGILLQTAKNIEIDRWRQRKRREAMSRCFGTDAIFKHRQIR
jgi:predicted RNA polymerase sigma factor